MEDADFSDDFIRFLQACVPSVQAAELLLQLAAGPEVEVRPRDAGEAKILQAFHAGGLVMASVDRWRKTADRLFLAFAAAFVLFALNQGLAAGLTVVLEPASLIYVLRVLGFILILAAIVDKNTTSGASTASGARRK